jgi:UPF0716 protein FxsA
MYCADHKGTFSMRSALFMLLLLPVLELALLIQVGSAIGVLPTLGLIILSAVLGILLLRVAGLATAWRARERLARGELPEREMFDGLLLALGGLLLLLPGFISDLFGLLCVLPFSRHLLLGRLQRQQQEQAARQRAFADDLAGARDASAQRPQVIEGEYQRRDS